MTRNLTRSLDPGWRDCYCSNMKKLPAQPVMGLIDGVRLLQELAAHAEPISGKALASTLKLEVTRVNRLLKTLDYLGLAFRTRDRKYQAGPAVQVLAVQSLVGSGFFARALPVLDELRQYHLTVALGVLWRSTVTYLYHSHPDTPDESPVASRHLFPAFHSSIGLLLLAELPEDEVVALYQAKDENSFASIAELRQELAKIRRHGYALLARNGQFTMAVKVGEPASAALALSGWWENHTVTTYLPILQRSAAAIAQAQVPS
jgi:DNA-binding IclR family transcriptional regulator